MLHTQLQHLPRDTFKFYLNHRQIFRDATTQASPSMLKHLSSNCKANDVMHDELFTHVKRLLTNHLHGKAADTISSLKIRPLQLFGTFFTITK